MLEKLTEALKELTKPILDAALLQDVLVEFMYYLCVVEGIHELEDRKAYIEYIMRHGGGYLETEIKDILDLVK